VPVVAPRSGGPIDVVEHGVTGFLYEPGSATELAAYVDRLAADRLFRRRMGLAARRSVRDRSWAGVNAMLVDHYREVIGVRDAGRRAA
jgi:phosphatidylinositol alpha 1,6-mannosyltransferase